MTDNETHISLVLNMLQQAKEKYDKIKYLKRGKANLIEKEKLLKAIKSDIESSIYYLQLIEKDLNE